MNLEEILSRLPDILDFGEKASYRYFNLDSNIAYYRNDLFFPQPAELLMIGVDMDQLVFVGTPEERKGNLLALLEWVETNCEYKETRKSGEVVWRVKEGE